MSDASREAQQHETGLVSGLDTISSPSSRKVWVTPKVIVGAMGNANLATISGTLPTDGHQSYIS